MPPWLPPHVSHSGPLTRLTARFYCAIATPPLADSAESLEFALATFALGSNLVVRYPDALCHERIAEILDRSVIAAALVVPLCAHGETLGVLTVLRTCGDQPFSQQEQWLCQLSPSASSAAAIGASARSPTPPAPALRPHRREYSLLAPCHRPQLTGRRCQPQFLAKARRSAAATIGCTIDAVFPAVLLQYTQLAQKISAVISSGQASTGDKLSYRAPGMATRVYFTASSRCSTTTASSECFCYSKISPSANALALKCGRPSNI
ncbi:GAF domain-containing protein [Candidatus Gracilibacteria bacterium]|nr:GAF domain-containing protein [Candidatus Gracilibacteria bacterium]